MEAAYPVMILYMLHALTSIKPQDYRFFIRMSSGLIEPVKQCPSILFIDCKVASIVLEVHIWLAWQISYKMLVYQWLARQLPVSNTDYRLQRG
jgi:hypothetical protein